MRASYSEPGQGHRNIFLNAALKSDSDRRMFLNLLIFGYPATRFLRSILCVVWSPEILQVLRIRPQDFACHRDTSDGFPGVEISGLAYDNPRRGLELIGRDERPEPSVD